MLGQQQGWEIPAELLAPPPPYRREFTPVSMSTDVLLSLLMLSVKPSDGLRADVFLAGFGNLPVQGRCRRNFQLFFKLLTFLS